MSRIVLLEPTAAAASHRAETWRRWLEDAGHEVLALIDRAIGDGVLVPAPREEACKQCDFRIVCGPWEEQRARGKKTPSLGDLLELRGRP